MKAMIIRGVIATFVLSASAAAFAAGPVEEVPERADMTLWFDKPAENRGESLALGNGRLGAVLHHGVTEELIQVSEETLWVNGPVPVAEGARM